jgi:holliday junction DNA helicase RuvA
MIGMLTGTIAYISNPSILLDVHGVGYKVLVSHTLISSVHVGESLTVYTHTHVREDVLELYGFADPLDLKVFEYLISVSGVGCKSALGVFSIGTRTDIVNAIATADTAFFSQVPRLGKKNSQKIIIELKNKVGGTIDLDLAEANDLGNEDVIRALQGFGYSNKEAIHALQGIKGQGVTSEEKIRLALKYLGK